MSNPTREELAALRLVDKAATLAGQEADAAVGRARAAMAAVVDALVDLRIKHGVAGNLIPDYVTGEWIEPPQQGQQGPPPGPPAPRPLPLFDAPGLAKVAKLRRRGNRK
jgi:hypothetical protein